MCNILYLKPGQMIPQEDFWNMCYNNWHSYGLVTKIDGKLDVKKKVPESGEIDPQEVWDLVKADVQFERFLHVRHNTAGATTLENAHPIPIYYDQASGKHIEFMHNGTLYQYKSKKKNEYGADVDDDSGPSDTMNFATQVLQPLIAGSNFGTGRGDIHHPFFKTIVSSFWPGASNRGLLIASDQAPLLWGDWKKIKADNDTDVATANTDYFLTVSRGPEFTRREAARKKAAQNSVQKVISSSYRRIDDVDTFQFGPQKKPYALPTTLKNIMTDWNIWTREGLASLACATKDELLDLHGDKSACVQTMDWAFIECYNMYEEILDLEEKHQKATLRIADLVNEIRELRKNMPDVEEVKEAA